MDILALSLGLAITAAAVWFVALPLRKARRAPARVESQLDTLLAWRESLYTQLRELDFDHATGKVVDADYAPLRERLKRQAADVLRRIDELTGGMPSTAEEEIEKGGARRKRRAAAAAAAGDELEAAIAARRKRKVMPAVAKSEAAFTCPNCGKALQVGDAFCSRCGAPVGAQVAQ